MSIETALAELSAELGIESHVTDWRPITQDMINQFAEVTGDHQWIHLDVERCKRESPFGTTIAHGMLTSALIPGFFEDIALVARYPDIKMGVNYGSNKIRYPSPVPANSNVRARFTLAKIDQIGDNALQLAHSVVMEIEGGKKPVCVAEVVSRLYW